MVPTPRYPRQRKEKGQEVIMLTGLDLALSRVQSRLIEYIDFFVKKGDNVSVKLPVISGPVAQLVRAVAF